MFPSSQSSTLPRARLPTLEQPPLDSITVYDTATHCYVLGTDSLQKNYHLITLSKHAFEHVQQSSDPNRRGSAGVGATAGAASESEIESGGGAAGPSSISGGPQSLSLVPDYLHDSTSYSIYSPTEAASFVDALRREHGTLLRTLSAVAFLGAVRFTAGYYLVLVTERRMAAYIGAHRFFEASNVDLISLLLDAEWLAAAEKQQQRARAQQQRQQLRLSRHQGLGTFDGDFSSSTSTAARGTSSIFFSAPRVRGTGSSSSHAPPDASTATTSSLFQRRSVEELYRQQFLTSLSRASSFFYAHSYDLTNTLQRNMLVSGVCTEEGAGQESVGHCGSRSPSASHRSSVKASRAEGQPFVLRQGPRMPYMWNEYLLEPWQICHHDQGKCQERSHKLKDDSDADGAPTPPRDEGWAAGPQYPPALARWRVFLIHGFVTQRVIAIRRPALHALLLTLIARVSKASAGVRYLRRGINSDGNVANHVEVEQIVSDESVWNATFSEGTLSSYVQLRGSVPLRWYHPPTASRLLPKPPIVLGPQDAQWSATCTHFGQLIEEYGAPILVHDLLKRSEHHRREAALGDAYRGAIRALVAAVDRSADDSASAATEQGATPGPSRVPRVRGSDMLQYESTDLRSLGQLAWNTMTAAAERHFDQVQCFVCRRSLPFEHRLSVPCLSGAANAAVSVGQGDRMGGVAVQWQCGIVRSSCLDCIDRTNIGQLFHGLHAMGEQLAGLGLLRHGADLRDSTAVTETFLEMYLAMGDAIAIQYGGSAQVGAGVLHRGAGWDQLMSMKRLYNNAMGDRDKQEAISLLLGRKQPQPRQGSRACNTEMHGPGQPALILPTQASSASVAPSLHSSITAASVGLGVALGDGDASSPTSDEPSNPPVSLLSGIREAAMRWWSAAVTTADAPWSQGPAATIKAAQLAAGEAEAEADYYEQVSAGPRLPLPGTLAKWWLRPLDRLLRWHAACGIPSRWAASWEGCDDGEIALDIPREEDASAASCRGLPISLTAAASPHSANVSVASAFDDSDRLALQFLAADQQVLEQWLSLVATVERQACLASTRHDGRAEASPRPMGNSDTNRAARSILGGSASGLLNGTAALSSHLGLSVRRGLAAGGLATVVSPLHMASAFLPGSASGAGLDEVALAPVAAATATAINVGGGVDADVFTGSLDRHTMRAMHAAVLPSAARSTIFPRCLFTEPWILLRPTANTALAQSTMGLSFLRKSLQIGVGSAAASCHGSTPEDAPRHESSSHPERGYGELHDTLSRPSWSIELAVVHSVWGCLPATVASATDTSALLPPLLQRHTPWCPAEQVHAHHLFPRIVRESIYAAHERNLEQLAYREAVWLSEGAFIPIKSDSGAPRVGPPEVAVRSSASATRQGASRRPPVNTGVCPAVAAHEETDRQFVALLLADLLGSPCEWGLAEVELALQHLAFPQPIPAAVLHVLRNRRIQPPLCGSELLVMVGQAVVSPIQNDSHSDMESYWRSRLLLAPQPSAREVDQRDPVAIGPWKRKPYSSVARWQTSMPRTSSAREPSPTHVMEPAAHIAGVGPVQAAAALLCRLAQILQSTGASRRASAPATADFISRDANEVKLVEKYRRMKQKTLGTQDCAIAYPGIGEDAVLLPFLEPCGVADVAARAQLRDFGWERINATDDDEMLASSVHQQWRLCLFLQPIFPRHPMMPSTLHSLLYGFFRELLFADGGQAAQAMGRLSPFSSLSLRRRYHVRYMLALAPSLRACATPPWQDRTQVPSRDDIDGDLGVGAAADLQRLVATPPQGSPTASPSASPCNLPGTRTSATPSMARPLHIPATLKVRYCCSALELHRWCAQHSGFSTVRPQGLSTPSQPPASTLAHSSPCSPVMTQSVYRSGDISLTKLRRTDTPSAVWHFLWWAMQNSFIAPVVRHQGQSILEVLADETALFCVVGDVARVALNVERSGRNDVWQQPQKLPSTLFGGATVEVPDSSAIYGVYNLSATSAATVPRVQRPLCGGALHDMMALSEALANLGLHAATQVQQFLRLLLVHDEDGSPLKEAGERKPTMVAMFGLGMVGAAGVLEPQPGEDGVQPALTTAHVVASFHRLASECLQPIQRTMVGLRYVSLETLVRDASMHSHIAFFANLYNATYMAAWLTNVRELVDNGAAAASMYSSNTPFGADPVHHHRSPCSVACPSGTRSIDLFPLPTLCNTNLSCYMHAYGVTVGNVFLSLEDIKYGILGGNRAPPYRGLPLWSAVPAKEVRRTPRERLLLKQIPLHLRSDIGEQARLNSLRQHPHLKMALHLVDLCDSALPPKTAAFLSPPLAAATFTARRKHSEGGVHAVAAARQGIPPVIAEEPRAAPSISCSLPSKVPAFSAASQPNGQDSVQRCPRRKNLLDLWSLDVVRHLSFRVLLQLLDTYLPPPIFHLVKGSDDVDRTSNVGGRSGSGTIRVPKMSEDTRNNSYLSGPGRVPWYLQPMLNLEPLMQPTLQSSKLGTAYGVARDGDGAAAGSLRPRVHEDANGVALQPNRMWSSPSYYVVGGDGPTENEAVSHSFQVLQTLAGSYRGASLYRAIQRVGGVAGPSFSAVADGQHLCFPLSSDHLFAQLHATETAFREALLASDPHLFYWHSTPLPSAAGVERRQSTVPSPLLASGSPSASGLGWGTSASRDVSCSAATQDAMRPIIYEWCQTMDDAGNSSVGALSKPRSSQWATVMAVQRLDASYASAEAVRGAQLAMRTTVDFPCD